MTFDANFCLKFLNVYQIKMYGGDSKEYADIFVFEI